MIDALIRFSIRQRVLVTFLAIAAGIAAAWYGLGLPIDAVPDITTNQVQINALAPGFAPQEMEKYVTSPIEIALASLPHKEEIRSLSQPGLSQVTVTLHDDADLYVARQLVNERLTEIKEILPPGVTAELAPISTGLGEIVQFAVESDPPGKYSLMQLRTILDWDIKPLLRTVPGVIEVNTYGGAVRQFEVKIDPAKLIRHGVSLRQVMDALAENNQNAGGAYLERGGEQELIRGVGLLQSAEDIERVVVTASQGVPLLVRDLGEVGLGQALRQGAATKDGKGEVTIGIVMLLKGENSLEVATAVRDKLAAIQKTLPAGVKLNVFYDRRELVQKTIGTAGRNLIEGGVLVAAILFLFLLQVRAGLIVASIIPLAMAFAAVGMRYFGVSANLMSLGAIDFGLIVDAAVIMVENSVRCLAEKRAALGRKLDESERLEVVEHSSVEVREASQFGEMIIIAAYLPVLALAGLEGKTFRPMAFTVILALSAALILSLTLVPALSALFLKDRAERHNAALEWLRKQYEPALRWLLANPWPPVIAALVFVLIGVAGFGVLGSEFIPELDEGAIA
ncbi:MAG: efflux RND transporter permease subunit, partial [Acidobacteria bacterium]|nr:efflux RND transporter permease subunit [Acidobacteriota bacterium]